MKQLPFGTAIQDTRHAWTERVLAVIDFQLFQQPAKPVAVLSDCCLLSVSACWESFEVMIHVETYTPLRFASFTVLTARSMTGFMDLSCQPNQMQLWFGATQISLSVYRPSSGLSNTLVLFSWVSKSKESICTLAAKFELISISHWENGGTLWELVSNPLGMI